MDIRIHRIGERANSIDKIQQIQCLFKHEDINSSYVHIHIQTVVFRDLYCVPKLYHIHAPMSSRWGILGRKRMYSTHWRKTLNVKCSCLRLSLIPTPLTGTTLPRWGRRWVKVLMFWWAGSEGYPYWKGRQCGMKQNGFLVQQCPWEGMVHPPLVHYILDQGELSHMHLPCVASRITRQGSCS